MASLSKKEECTGLTINDHVGDYKSGIVLRSGMLENMYRKPKKGEA